LLDDGDAPVTVKPPIESAYEQRKRYQKEGKPAPFDSEAT